MDLAECFRQANGDAREAHHIQWLPLIPLKNPIHRLTARLLKHENRPSFVSNER